MQPTRILKSLLLAALFVPGGARAARAQESDVSEPEPAAWSLTLTTGYDSRSVLYGYRLSRHLIHADLYAWRPITDSVSVWAGAWAGYLTDGTYRQVDACAGFDVALSESFSVGLDYTLFGYLEVPFSDKDTVSALAAQAVYQFDGLTLTLRDQYDFEAEGHLARAIASYTRPVAGPVSLRLEAEFGYAFQYYIEGNRPNHALFTLGLPVQINESVGMEVFLSRSLALGAIRAFEEHVTYGGLSLSRRW